MNSDNKESRSNFGHTTGALCQVFVALAILAALLPLPRVRPVNQEGMGQALRDSLQRPARGLIAILLPISNRLAPTYITVDITETFSGTLDGCYAGTERDVVYKNGSATFHGSGIFTGVVNGQSGTMVMTYEGTANSQGGLPLIGFSSKVRAG